MTKQFMFKWCVGNFTDVRQGFQVYNFSWFFFVPLYDIMKTEERISTIKPIGRLVTKFNMYTFTNVVLYNKELQVVFLYRDT